MNINFNENDLKISALTVWGEARGEFKKWGLASFIVIANTIMNRFLEPKRFGMSLAQVCQKPLQFSVWNKFDKNYALLACVDEEDKLYKISKESCLAVFQKKWPDLTGGANHYHADYVSPSWATNKKHTMQIGRHIFYKL